MSFFNSRQSEQPIDSLFINRWSPRGFVEQDVPDKVLFSAFEAARWAPSGYNGQPWRFIYSKRSDPDWSTFVDLLNERNRQWAPKASALVLLVSKKSIVNREGLEVASESHSFDSGAAWANFTLQANILGWYTHGIGGFDRDKARQDFKIPENYSIEILIAIGKQGDDAALPDELRKIESPNSRKPLRELVFRGNFDPRS